MSAIVRNVENSRYTFRQKLKIQEENREIVKILEELQDEMEFLYNSFETLTEPILVDSCVFQLQALNMRYQYYLSLCKERGVTHSIRGNKYV